MTYRLTVSPDFSQDMIASWYLFNTWLQKRIDAPIHLELYYDFESQRQAVARDEIDLIFANAFELTTLVRERGFTAIAAPADEEDEVVLAVPAASGVDRVEALKSGTRIAHTVNSDVNRIGMILLEPADLTAANTVATKVATYVLVAKSLMQGRADVGFFLKRTYDELSGVIRRELRPIVESQIGVIRHTLLGGPRSAPLTAKLQQALFTMTEDPAGVRVLESLGLGGWVPQQPEETEFLIDVIETLSE